MKKLQIGFIVAACSCIILAHFFRLSTYLINFPTWGDDLIFLSYFTDLSSFSFPEFWERTFEFHSYIHRIPMARLATALYAIMQPVFDFKVLTIAANLLTLSVIYPLTKLLIRHQINLWHLVGLIALLYAPNGNLDNFALIGVLQHMSSLIFLIWISYGLSDDKHRTWGIWLSLLYPMFSTEGLAFIPMTILLLVYLRDSRVWLYCAGGAIVSYCYFLGYASPETIPSSGTVIEKLLFTVKGTMVFVGGAIKKDLTISLMMGSLFIGYSAYILWKFHQTKNSALLFSGLILIQIMAVGAMITLGRGNAQAGDLGVLFSERFSSYGVVFILICYFAAIQPALFNFSPTRLWLLIPAIIWVSISTVVVGPKLKNLHTRLVADANNAYHFNINTLYRFEEKEINLLKKSGRYTFPSEIIPLPLIKSSPLAMMRLTPLPAYEVGINEYSIEESGILLVVRSNKPNLFLPINSLSHSVKIKKDIPFDQQMSHFVLIQAD